MTYSRGDYPELSELGCTHIRGDLHISTPHRSLQRLRWRLSRGGQSGNLGTLRRFLRGQRGGHAKRAPCLLRNGIESWSTPARRAWFMMAKARKEKMNPSYPKSFSPIISHQSLAEQEVLAADGDKLATVALRPHLVWGPRDHHFLLRPSPKEGRQTAHFGR